MVGRARFRDVVFLHWPVAPETLRPHVPAPLELDLRDGRAYASVVAFAMRGLRPALVPEALGIDHLEVNLRTYVRGPGGEPGIFFFSLDADARTTVAIARAGAGVPAHGAEMRLTREGATVAYEMRRRRGRGPLRRPEGAHARGGPRLALRCEIGDPLGEAAEGTLERFLVERYSMFSVRGRGRLVEVVRIRHAPWRLRRARLLSLENGLFAAAGIAAPDGPPALALYDEACEVEILAPAVVR